MSTANWIGLAVVGAGIVAGGAIWSDRVDQRIKVLEDRPPVLQPASVAFPPGAVLAFASTGCPEGWTQFDQANGRMIVGIDGRAEFAVTFPRGEPVYATGGEEEVTLTVEQMPRHDHHFPVADGPNNSYWWHTNVIENNTSAALGGNGSISFNQRDNVIPEGLGRPHNNMPPYIALYWCMPEPTGGG